MELLGCLWRLQALLQRHGGQYTSNLGSWLLQLAAELAWLAGCKLAYLALALHLALTQ